MFSQAILASALFAPLASAAIIDVFVGGTGILAFNPPSVTANVGDSIRFTFGPKNHTVTQSTFAAPCTEMTDTTGKPAGFFSGYMPVAGNQTTDLPQFWIPVTDTKPIWAFCSQTGHCSKGMVFAVNAPAAPAANSFDNFRAAAMGQAPAASNPAPAPAAAAVSTTAPTSTSAVPLPANNAAGVSTSAPAASQSGTPTASGPATTHTVVVGGAAGLVFTPNNLQANIGDVVQFSFEVKNHTVTQSTLKAPCTSNGGFDSGFMPVAADATTFPTYSITVNQTTTPIWAYCRQANHCQQGMVFAINANQTAMDTFTTNAKASNSSSSTSGAYPSTSAQASGAVNGVAMPSSGKMALIGATVASLAFGLML